MRIKMLFMSVMVAMAVVATPVQAQQSNILGCLLGAGAGGFGGSKIGSGSGQLAAVGAGTLLGCMVGSKIQQSMNQPQQPSIYQQTQSRYGGQRWQQPSVTSRYNSWPGVQQQQQRKPTCPYSREYQSTVTVGGRQVPAYGQACSWDGGQTWRLGALSPIQ